MASRLITHTVGAAAGKVPGLRRLPVARLLLLGEVALLAREHLQRLTPQERRRLVVLVRTGRGRRSRLSDSQRRELERLLDTLAPRVLAGAAVDRLSPVPLPARLLYGRRGRP